MKVRYVVGVVLVCLLLAGTAQTEKTQMRSKSVSTPGQHSQAFEKKVTKTVSCMYLLFLPEGYGEKDKRWPLMMFLHGAGERGDDLEKVKKHGPPKIVQKRKDFPFIVVSPQCPSDAWWPEKREVLISLLDDIEARYDVDKERVYLTGLSMGGYGTWALACAYPERFAAIAPICGGGQPFLTNRLKNVPVWAFHGAKDPLVPLRQSEDMVKAIKRFGGNAKLTVYPDAGHDSWSETYNNQELYDWFLQHKNKSKKK